MTPSQTRMAPFSAYVALVRGLAVDFGLGGLVDKFDERFGKRVTTALLAATGLGLLAASIGAITQYLILPIINLYENFTAPAFKEWAQSDLFPALVAIAILFPVVNVLTFVGFRIYDRLIGEKQRIKRATKIVDDLSNKQIAEVRTKLDEFYAETQAKISANSEEVTKAAINKAHQFFDEKSAELLELSKNLDEHRQAAISFLDVAHEAIDPENPEATKEALLKLRASLEQWKKQRTQKEPE